MIIIHDMNSTIDLPIRLGRNGEAAVAYEAAVARTQNVAGRDFLQRRHQAMTHA